MKKRIFKGKDNDCLKYISMGLAGLGTAGLMLSSKYDINRRGNMSYLVENFVIPEKNEGHLDTNAYEGKVIYISGTPRVDHYARDNYFNITVKNCVYLRRYSEMYQTYRDTQTTTDSKGNKHTEVVYRHKWSDTVQDPSLNATFPEHVQSVNFISTDIFLKNFGIHPGLIYKKLKNKEVAVNIKGVKDTTKDLDNHVFKWDIRNNYIYGYRKNCNNDIRVCFYALSLNPANGLSIVGLAKNGNIVPIDIADKSNFTSVYFLKDYIETPINMIGDYVISTRNYFYSALALSFTLICVGFYLSNIGDYVNNSLREFTNEESKIAKTKYISSAFSKLKSPLLNKNPKFFISSIFMGVCFSLFIYSCFTYIEKENIKSKNKISKLYSYKQLLDLEYAYDENPRYELFIGHKLE